MVRTNQRLPVTEIPGMSKIVPRMVVPEQKPHKLTTESREWLPGAVLSQRINGIRANVHNPRLSDQTIIIRLHGHGFGSRRPMKVPQRTNRHDLAIGHLRHQLGRAVCVRLTPNHNLGHLRQIRRE